MTGPVKPGRPALDGLEILAHGHAADQLEAFFCVGLGVERQGRLVFGEAVAVGKVGVGLLDVAAVGQKNLRQIARGRCGPHLAVKAFLGQQGQVATVVQVGVGEDHRADVVGFHRQRIAVAQSQLFETLEQAAVDEQAFAFVLDQVFGTGHRAGTAQESDIDAHESILLRVASAAPCQPPLRSNSAGFRRIWRSR